MTFTVLGEALIDISSGPLVKSSASPGGSPLNVAVGLARLGQEVALLTHIGDDVQGELLRTHLRDNGVRTVAGSSSPFPTSVARAHINADGSAHYEFDITWNIPTESPDATDFLSAAQAVHTGSLATQLAPGKETVYEYYKASRSHALTSYDPNCRPSIVKQAAVARLEVERFVGQSDIVKASDEDIKWLYPGTPYRKITEKWLQLGASLILITRGDEGVWSHNASGQTVDLPATQINVIDTVGAGDAFMAATLFGLAERSLLGANGKEEIRDMSRKDLIPIIQQAARAAAITCTRSGSNPPTLSELLALQHADGPRRSNHRSAQQPQ